jgi:hypothetical protein
MKTLTVAILATCVSLVAAGIYPDDHWSYSKELTTENAQPFIKEGVDAGKTVFVRWIASEG